MYGEASCWSLSWRLDQNWFIVSEALQSRFVLQSRHMIIESLTTCKCYSFTELLRHDIFSKLNVWYFENTKFQCSDWEIYWKIYQVTKLKIEINVVSTCLQTVRFLKIFLFITVNYDEVESTQTNCNYPRQTYIKVKQLSKCHSYISSTIIHLLPKLESAIAEIEDANCPILVCFYNSFSQRSTKTTKFLIN